MVSFDPRTPPTRSLGHSYRRSPIDIPGLGALPVPPPRSLEQSYRWSPSIALDTVGSFSMSFIKHFSKSSLPNSQIGHWCTTATVRSIGAQKLTPETPVSAPQTGSWHGDRPMNRITQSHASVRNKLKNRTLVYYGDRLINRITKSRANVRTPRTLVRGHRSTVRLFGSHKKVTPVSAPQIGSCMIRTLVCCSCGARCHPA